MTFWIIIAAIAALVALLLGRAVLSARAGAAAPAAYDLQIYRDQLKEVARDRDRSVIGAAEAERVTTEIKRRILTADAQLRKKGEGNGQPRGLTLALALAVGLALLGGSGALYWQLGTPGYTDLPIKARLDRSDEMRANRLTQAEAAARLPATPAPEASAEFLALMDQLRKTVAARPDDLRGLLLLARNEAALGNFAAAHDVQARIIALKDGAASAQDHAFHAELLISAAGGYVSQEAEAALRAALTRDPKQPFARYYMAQYLMQVDRPDAAFRTLRQLLEDSTPDAPWLDAVRGQIEEVARRAGVDYQLPPLQDAPGPSAADIDAAQDMSPEERQQMIRGMVAGLSDRLATEGGTPDEWARLIRALGVLGDTDQARAIWGEAQQVFDGRTEALETLRAAASEAGVAE